MQEGCGPSRRDLVQRHVPGCKRDAKFASAKSHHRLTAPTRRKKFRLAGERVTDPGQLALAHRSGDDAGKFPALAAFGGAFHRGPGHERAFAVGLAGDGHEFSSPTGFPPRIDEPAKLRPITATSSDCCVGREPGRDDFPDDAGRIAAGEASLPGTAPSLPSPAAGRASPRLPAAKNSRKRRASALATQPPASPPRCSRGCPRRTPRGNSLQFADHVAAEPAALGPTTTWSSSSRSATIQKGRRPSPSP